MGLIYLALYKGRGTLFNRLVRLWTRSKYSHCELVLADGRWLSASAMDGGVRAKHIELNLEHWDLIPLLWANHRQIARVFRANAGQGYDFFGLFGSQLLPVGLHSRRRWFCSEFCAAALGFPMPQRYSPAQLGEVVQHINTLTPSGQWNETHA